MNRFTFIRKISGVLWLVVCVLIGCGKRDDSLVDVRGEVTFCGQPAIAEVLFEPISSASQTGGRASSAMTDDRGQFRLMYDGSQAGAKRGKHRVTIRVLRIAGSEGEPKVAASSGDTAGSLKTTQLVREVGDKPARFRFPLSF